LAQAALRLWYVPAFIAIVLIDSFVSIELDLRNDPAVDAVIVDIGGMSISSPLSYILFIIRNVLLLSIFFFCLYKISNWEITKKPSRYILMLIKLPVINKILESRFLPLPRLASYIFSFFFLTAMANIALLSRQLFVDM